MADYTWNYLSPYDYMDRIIKRSFPPLIITVAITGGVVGKEENPNLPETPEEQVEQTYEAYKAGASIVHIHVRNEAGDQGIAESARFRDINKRIRDACPDILISNSTAAGITVPRDQVLQILDADPEICSLNLGPLALKMKLKGRRPPLRGRPEDVEVDLITPITYGDQEAIARKALQRGIKPELEVYNASMLYGLQNLIRQDLVKKPYWVEIIFGGPNELPSMNHLLNQVNGLPAGTIFSVIGIGPFQLPLTTMSILLGGHVRVGMEDNIYYRKGELAKSNAQLVERVVRIARELDREIATPAQARAILGISEVPRSY